jgi:hypothetical protein
MNSWVSLALVLLPATYAVAYAIGVMRGRHLERREEQTSRREFARELLEIVKAEKEGSDATKEVSGKEDLDDASR